MTVVYYTSMHFLEVSIEIINALKTSCDLHVIIEITPSSRKVNVIDVEELPENKKLVSPQELLSKKDFDFLEPYLKGTASTHFAIHHHNSGFSYSTLSASFEVWKFVKKFKPQIIHFEGFTFRTIGFVPFLFFFKKVFLIIHDPIPHSGESNWKVNLPRMLFFYLPYKRHFVFYSEFSKNQFSKAYKRAIGEKFTIKLYPFYFYKDLLKEDTSNKTHILFFGRISKYKGIDVLLKAMPMVLKEFPDERLIVAGKAVNNYNFDTSIVEKHKNNISLFNRYIPKEEVLQLIGHAKFIICPYLDATQSAVIMTSFALQTPIIASDVGAFSESIEDNYNGLLVPPGNPALLAEKIISALKDDRYKQLQQNIDTNRDNSWQNTIAILLDKYRE